MSSYYKNVVGNLKENETARVADIRQIQSNIIMGEQEYTTDMFGPSFILGSEEDSFKLTPTTDYIDQFNNNYDEDKSWISFYDIYLRQSIYTTKSAIESIKIHVYNGSNISTTIYAEIRDTNFEIIKEASAILNPTDPNIGYNEVTFNFGIQHLPVGVYYFILRPVDISATDLTVNGDETPYDTITYDMFRVKYDVNGEYHRNLTNYGTTEDTPILRGLEASYNGDDYLDAYLLPDQELTAEDFNELDADDPNYDLFFEEAYSSFNTYLVNNSDAIVLGQKVEPCDTHVRINGPSTLGDRTDLVTLRADGTYQVLEGPTYNGERIYPVDNTGLPIAYVTTFKNGNKVALIEQDDEYESVTRQRSLLERVRRVEKKSDYQMTNNSPSRIKYNCEVDPIMFNNGLTTEQKDAEGSYRLGLSTNENGEQIVSGDESVNLIWSIVKNNYKYTQEATQKTAAYCQVYHVHTSTTAKTPTHSNNGLYVVYLSKRKLSSENDNRTINDPLKKETIKVTIKKGSSTKKTKTLTTNSNGRATWNLNALKLPKGTYNVYTSVSGNKDIKTKLTVHSGTYTASNGHVTSAVTVKDTIKEKVKDTFNNNTITGDDAFDTDNGKIAVDTKNGVIELAKVDTSKDPFVSNKTLNTTDKPRYNYRTVAYTIKHDTKATSHFPVLHLSFDRDTTIKSIRPNINNFKNMKNFGILLFKNDQVLNMKHKKRTVVEKNFKKDIVYTNIYKASKSLSGASTDKNGKQHLNNFVTFTPKNPIKLEAGTYSLLVFGETKKNKDGIIYLRHYDTHGNLEEYGMAATCTGSSNLSTLKMKSSNLTSESWNVKITQRPDKYQTSGTVTSNTKNTSNDIYKCSVSMNTDIPAASGCGLKLYVSNDGGNNWVYAQPNSQVHFTSSNNIFRWKMELEGNGKYTPRLLYSTKKKYAIKFSLNTQTFYVPYEDFGRCYETPLLNANSITKTFVANANIRNRFSEWEWARIFMLDETAKSNIDICFSYNDDDVSTNVSTLKSNWDKKTFFSQIFADLELSDFTTESIDYDNYEGNVEFDEHNYLFKMNSNYVMHNTGGIALATPTYIGEKYTYGNIADEDNKTAINQLFDYTIEKDKYTYYGNEDSEPMQFSGTHVTRGPYVGAVYKGSTDYKNLDDNNKYNYIINGITFPGGIEIDESKAELSIQLFPITGIKQYSDEEIKKLEEAVQNAQQAFDNPPENANINELETALTNAINALNAAKTANAESQYKSDVDTSGNTVSTVKEKFAPNSFNINIALTLDGTIPNQYITDSDGNQVRDLSNGISYTIPYELKANEFNIVTIDISENIEAFKANGIRSIGISINEAADLKKGEGIGIGTISAASYSRRPYVPYMYTGNWSRLKWQPLKPNAKIYNLCKAGGKIFFYPSHDANPNQSEETITQPTGLASESFGRNGTFITINDSKTDKNVDSISRKNNEITFNIGSNAYKTTNTGNEVIFEFPQNTTGDIFRIDTDIPLSIYDLIDIEYYIYHTKQTSNLPTTTDLVDYDNYVVYDGGAHRYYGYISKGDIKIKFYTQTDIDENTVPVETFTLPSWGRVQQNARVTDKTVHAWFKIRSAATRIRTIIIERANPTNAPLDNIKLGIGNMLLYNAETMPALGPQMQMRIYPQKDLSEIQIRKVGCVYRI